MIGVTKMQKIKVLYMTMSWNHAGTEAYMLNVFDHIDRLHYDIDVALPGEFKWENEDTLIQRDINVIHYPAYSLSQQIREIKKILNVGDYDVVHVMQQYVAWETYMFFALVAIAERKRHHYKVICHAHGKEDKTKAVPPILKRTARNAFRNVLRWGLSRADLLAACSQEAGEFLYGSKRKVEIFDNGIDLQKFRSASSSNSISQWREKYGIDAGKKNFAIVGRMAEQKNPLFALDVIQALSQYYPDVRLIWAGDGDMRKDIEIHMEEIGIADRVQLLGAQDHVEEILACCDYFLLPSKFEGLGIVFIEAQAAGLHCFTSDQVPKDADCGGVTFIPLDKSAEQWAEEIHRQIEAEPKANIDMERLSRFDINRTAADLSEVYKRLVER